MSSIDNHIKNTLKDFSPEVPTHIWENIMAERKRRRSIFWFSFGDYRKIAGILLLLLLTAGIVYYNYHSTPSSGKAQLEGEMQPSTINSIEKGQEENNRANAGNYNNSTAIPVNPSNKTTAHKANATDAKASDHAEISSSHSPRNETKKNRKRSNRMDMATADIQIQNPSFAPWKNDDISSGIEKRTRNKKKNKKEIPYIAGTFGKIIEAEVDNTPQNSIQESKDNSEHLLIPETTAFSKRSVRSISLNIIPFKPGLGKIPCPANVEGLSRKYIEFYAGPDMTFRSYRDTGNSAYLLKRKEATSTVFAYSAGARFNKIYNNGISLQAGISYSHVIEKFKIVEGNVIQQVFILNANGDTIGNYMSVGTRYKTNYNQYHTIDLPLMAGYEFGNNKWHAAFHAGTVVNVYSWQKGYMLDSAYKAVPISTGDAPSPYQFKTNIGFGLAGSASLIFNINKHAQWMLEPYFRYNLSTVNKEAITLRQKFHSAGLRFGIRYQF